MRNLPCLSSSDSDAPAMKSRTNARADGFVSGSFCIELVSDCHSCVGYTKRQPSNPLVRTNLGPSCSLYFRGMVSLPLSSIPCLYSPMNMDLRQPSTARHYSPLGTTIPAYFATIARYPSHKSLSKAKNREQLRLRTRAVPCRPYQSSDTGPRRQATLGFHPAATTFATGATALIRTISTSPRGRRLVIMPSLRNPHFS